MPQQHKRCKNSVKDDKSAENGILVAENGVIVAENYATTAENDTRTQKTMKTLQQRERMQTGLNLANPI